MAEIPLPVTPFYSPSTQKFRENPDDFLVKTGKHLSVQVRKDFEIKT